MSYDAIVVGAGLIGSATAKYIAKSGLRVCIVGPAEPDVEDYHKTTIFGSHYDEGRITRRIDCDPFWAHVAAKSIARYGKIETESGISFHTQNGCLIMGEEKKEYIKAVKSTARKLKIRVQNVESAELEKRFPFFNYGRFNRLEGVFEVGTG